MILESEIGLMTTLYFNNILIIENIIFKCLFLRQKLRLYMIVYSDN
jgi:hypothetical protein